MTNEAVSAFPAAEDPHFQQKRDLGVVVEDLASVRALVIAVDLAVAGAEGLSDTEGEAIRHLASITADRIGDAIVDLENIRGDI